MHINTQKEKVLVIYRAATERLKDLKKNNKKLKKKVCL